MRPHETEDERYKKIFVGGLPRDLDTKDFKEYFE